MELALSLIPLFCLNFAVREGTGRDERDSAIIGLHSLLLLLLLSSVRSVENCLAENSRLEELVLITLF